MLQRYIYCMPRRLWTTKVNGAHGCHKAFAALLPVWPWKRSRVAWCGAWSGDYRSTHAFRRHAPRTRTPQLTDGAGLDKVIIIENCPLFKASGVPRQCYLRNLGRCTHLVGISWKLPEVFHSHQSISTPARINPTEKPRRNSTRATSK